MASRKQTFDDRDLKRMAREERADGYEPRRTSDDERPLTRADCRNGIRPCPFVGCRHHLLVDVNELGHIIGPLGLDIETLTQAADSCALDLAERHSETGGMTLEQVGDTFGLTRERIRQLEAEAFDKLRAYCERHGLSPDGVLDALLGTHPVPLTPPSRRAMPTTEISQTLQALGFEPGERQWIRQSLSAWIEADEMP